MSYRFARHRRRPRRVGKLLRLVVILLIVVGLLFAFDAEVRPVILTMAGYQAKVTGVLAINDTVLELMQKQDPETDLVQVQYNSAGEISSIETNTVELNRLKAELTNAVGLRLAEIGKSRISMPIGTLLGWQIFAGRGPDIHFKVIPASFVQSEIRSSLVSAGINQTKYQILICFTVEMTAIIPGYTTSVTVTNEVPIAETLIVGTVPQFYAGKTAGTDTK